MSEAIGALSMEEIQEILRQNAILKKDLERVKNENVKLKKKRKPKAKNPISLYSGGKKQYDEKEQEEFEEEDSERKTRDITEPRGTFFNPKTENIDSISLQKHQKQFLLKFINSDARGAIVFHGTGTGKTLTAVATSYAFLRYNPSSRVFVITPSATQQNFIFGMVQFGLDIRDNRYKFYTYDRYFRHGVDCDDALMIIDEAHNFRTFIQRGIQVNEKTGETEEKVIKNKKGDKVLEHCAKKAKKVLLLTATPFINVLYDLENLLAMVSGTDPLDESTYYDITSSKEQRRDYFACVISKFELPVSDDFPEKIESLVPIYMDEDFLKAYKAIESSESTREKAFFNGVRRITNGFRSVNNSKVNFIMKLIKPNQKIVIYTTYLENGIRLLKSRLRDDNIEFAEITGVQNAIGKEISKNRFNHFVPDDEGYRNKVRSIGIDPTDPTDYNVNVLLITKASAEGVDLIGTNAMVLMDGAWNESGIQQIIARAVRFRSHTHLPKDQQKVNVYRMILTKPTDEPIVNKAIADFRKPQWDIILSKFLEINALHKNNSKKAWQRKEGRIIDRSINLQDKTIDTYLKRDNGLSAEQVRAMPKNQRREAWKSVQFDRMANEKKQGDLLRLSNQKPSVDLYMLVRSKAKQIVIDNFVEILDKETDTVEKCISPLEQAYMVEVNKLQEEKGREITPPENDAIRKRLFSSGIASFAKRVKKNGQAIQDKLTATLLRAKEKKEKISEKLLLSGFQEYFTPPEVAREMIKRVGLADDKNDNLRILEPSAGNGALIEPLLERMGEGKQFYKIDAVEFKPENREILKEYSKTDNFRLMNEGNFLKFVPPKKYDYVLMNPPFHLKRTFFPNLYKRDVYDVDFVKRAFSMLDVGGRLIALTSQASLNNNREPFKSFNDWIKGKNHSITQTTIKWKGSKAVKKAKEDLMKRLSLTNFLYIILVKEEKDMDEDAELLKISADIFLNPNTPLIAEDIPVELYNNEEQEDFYVETPRQASAQEQKDELIRKLDVKKVKKVRKKKELTPFELLLLETEKKFEGKELDDDEFIPSDEEKEPPPPPPKPKKPKRARTPPRPKIPAVKIKKPKKPRKKLPPIPKKKKPRKKPPPLKRIPPTIPARPPTIPARPPTIPARPPTIPARPPTIPARPPPLPARPPPIPPRPKNINALLNSSRG